MLNNSVEASFWPGEGYGARMCPNLSGVGAVVSQVYPSHVTIEVIATPAHGICCQLEATFAEPVVGGVDLAQAFKRALIRLEGDSGYQVFWGRDTAKDLATWTYLRPSVPNSHLPSGKPITVALPMAAIAHQLFDQMRVRDATFSYRVELARVDPQHGLLRALIPALAELQQGSQTARGLAAELRAVLERARQEGWFALETFGSHPDDARAKAWIEETIVREVTAATPLIRRDVIDLRWGARAAFQLPRDAPDYAAGLRSRDYVISVFDSIDSIPVPQRAKPTLLPISLPTDLSGRPTGQSARDYAFVSYAHKNADLVSAVTQHLDGTGISYWLDDGIDPGARWDEKLEERIANCSVLVACLSNEYQSSRYCRRELKFADLLGKPIVPVSMAPVGWNEGLRFMFQEIQICTLSSDAGWDRFTSGLARAASGIFTRAV